MRRREFIGVLSTGAVGSPWTALGQGSGRPRRLSVLVGLAEGDSGMKPRLNALRQELETAGWMEGTNIQVEYRFAPGGAGAVELAREAVARRPDVILAHTVAVTAAVKGQTTTIPIVFVSVGDPLGTGFVSSLSRPEGNLTGFMTFEPGVAGKWLGMLREVAPDLTRVLLVASAKTTTYDYYRRGAEAAAPALMLDLLTPRVATVSEMTEAVESFARVSNGGLVVAPDLMTSANGDLLVGLAARHRLPAVYAFSYLVSAGGLMSYGTDRVAEMRQAASYINRILRGAQPEELPVQTPTKFETFVNLTTAKALGLTIPLTLLARADEVIE